jgi:hypothetical protein
MHRLSRCHARCPPLDAVENFPDAQSHDPDDFMLGSAQRLHRHFRLPAFAAGRSMMLHHLHSRRQTDAIKKHYSDAAFLKQITSLFHITSDTSWLIFDDMLGLIVES